MGSILEKIQWLRRVLGARLQDPEPESVEVSAPQKPPKPEKSEKSETPSGDLKPPTRKIADDIAAAEKRLARERDAGADRPTQILDRRSYVTSEIALLRQRVAKEAAEQDRPPLLQRVEAMAQAMAETEAAAMRRALAALRQDVANARQALQQARSLAEQGDSKGAYKLATQAAAQVFASETDWQMQVKLGRSIPGTSDLAAPLKELSQQRGMLDDAVSSLLPTLKSKIDPKPIDDSAVTAPDKLVIQPGEELQVLKACGKDWAQAKETYGRYGKEMQKLADYRKRIVDEWLKDTLQPWGLAEGPGKGWVAVGSKDPTSDYDISVNRHGTRKGDKGTEVYHDYRIVQDFNAYFRKKFGCETGTIFDTNLYASAPGLVLPPPAGDNEQENEAYEEVVASNDIGALMKQRRYMSGEAFTAYREQVLEGIPEPARSKMAKRFQSAEDNYMISVLTTIETMREQLRAAQQDGGELSEEHRKALKIVEEWDQKKDVAEGTDMIEAAAYTEHVAHELMHACKDASTMSTNEIYAQSIGNERAAEDRVRALNEIRTAVEQLAKSMGPEADPEQIKQQLEALALQLEPLEPRAAEHLRKGIASGSAAGMGNGLVNAQGSIEQMAPGLLSDLARSKALTMFYANEAYQSGGPFKHVVYAGQAVMTDVRSDPKMDGVKDNDPAFIEEVKRVTLERRNELTASERLDSFNEQLGDFLKDLAHYGDDDPGVAIIQSSKYLDRLIDAAALLNEKGLLDAEPALQQDIQAQIDKQQDVRDQLIAARKGRLVMEPLVEGQEINQVEERRAFACEFMRGMGISSVAALGRVYTQLGMRVNVAVRKQLAV